MNTEELKQAKKECEQHILNKLHALDMLIAPAQVKNVAVEIHKTNGPDKEYSVQRVDIDLEL